MSYYRTTRYKRLSNFGKFILAFISMMTVGLTLTAAVGLLFAILIYFLWNWLMPDLFGLTTITYWQAWGVYFLSSMLFKLSPSLSSKD